MKPPETFTTPRLMLRPPVLADAETIFQGYAQDPLVTKYLPWKPHANLEATQQFLTRCIQRWKDETAFPWVIVRKADHALLGMIEMRIPDFRADFGYVVGRLYWGNGFATEAAQTIVQWAAAQAGIFRVWAICDVENRASARVLEKAGLQREGVLRRYVLHPSLSNEPRDCYCYSLVKKTKLSRESMPGQP
jgi:[ribosomal protein S5]-alanine N-acetyltransferase